MAEMKIVGFASKSNAPKVRFGDFPWWMTEAAEWRALPLDDPNEYEITLKSGWRLEEDGFPVRIDSQGDA